MYGYVDGYKEQRNIFIQWFNIRNRNQVKTIAIFDATIESIYCIQIRYLSPAAHSSSLIHRKGEVAHL